MAVVQTGQNSWIDTATGKAVANPATQTNPVKQPDENEAKAQKIISGVGFGYDTKTADEQMKAAGLDPAKYQDRYKAQMDNYAKYREQSAQHGMTDAQRQRQELGWTDAEQKAARAAAIERNKNTALAEMQASATTQGAPAGGNPLPQITSQEGAANLTTADGQTISLTPTPSPTNTATTPTPAPSPSSGAGTSSGVPTAAPAKPAAATDWMKDVYKQWQEAYGKEVGYRDKLMGDVAGASYDPAQAMQFAQQQAQDAAVRDTDAASRAAIRAARTAGINPAQAALISGQKASDAYNTALGQQQQQALAQYNTSRGQQIQAAGLTGQMQSQLLPSAVQMQGNQLNYQAAMQGYKNAKDDSERDFWGRMLFGMAPLAGALFSDKDVKDNIKTVSYTYKGQSRPEVGVLAQDLEKTPLKTSVFQGPGGVKMVDTNRLTTQNTAMIADLARKVDKIAKAWEGK